MRASLTSAPFGSEFAERLKACGLSIHTDAFDPAPVRLAVAALREGQAFSVVRMGEGEGAILTCGEDAGTPYTDRLLVAELMQSQGDRFKLSEPWFHILREQMIIAACDADVLGVRGLVSESHEERAALVEKGVTISRGPIGHLRCRACILRLAETGLLRADTIASAYLYAAVARNLDLLVGSASQALLITSEADVVEAMRRRYERVHFEFIPVGASVEGNQPRFLDRMSVSLSRDLAGWLCLVGAGPWAKTYCRWAKQAGAVAIDLGSGFDLLGGRIVRPIHRRMGERLNALKLT